jgi:HSP20 family protein
MKALFRRSRFEWFGSELSQWMKEYRSTRIGPATPHFWQPAINVFRCECCIRVCVDIAGVDKSKIHVKVDARRLTVRGEREVPEPIEGEARALRVLALEIDYGPFQREIDLPEAVDVDAVTAEQREGLLWIEMPVQEVRK